MGALLDAQNAYLAKMDVNYSYRLAKSMEQFRTNPTLGYRTAGSRAEFLTGEMLFEEMKRIGLTDVTKDPFTLDTWEFESARMCVTDEDGSEHYFELGGYQTDFRTGGWKEYTLVYAGRGTAADLDGLDVAGKLVLVDINQRDDWWISYPVYQAHLRGAAAVIAVQNNGYAEIDSTALNAQNICGPADAPAFSLSRADAEILRAQTGSLGGETQVLFSAKSTVGFDGVSYNIVGKIRGSDPESMLLMSAHYDSYFSGFQDDNAAVALMMGIARAIVASGYKPRRTLVFCAMAAEEWGVSDTKYDWSTGAYNQIFRVHPDWVGKVIADINFELPAYAHDTQDVIRCVYEYQTFLTGFASRLPDVSRLYPDGVSVASPVMTWSDDFSMAIAGVPSLVNDFAEGTFMETHYHSQFDNDDAYEEHIYAFHHALYGMLMLAYDHCAVAPLDFSPRLEALKNSLDPDQLARRKISAHGLSAAVTAAMTRSELCYKRVCAMNHHYLDALDDGDYATANLLYDRAKPLNAALLQAFKHCEDAFVRLTWHDHVIFPHEYAQQNLPLLEGALTSLASGDVSAALDRYLLHVDANWYAYHFDLEVCRHFVEYAQNQPAERLMWGAGRIPGLCDLFEAVQSLLGKQWDTDRNLVEEADAVRGEIGKLAQLLESAVSGEENAVKVLSDILSKAEETREFRQKRK